MSALKGTRIIEVAESVSGEYCGKLLADFGAQVIKIERAITGSPTRNLPPLVKGSDGNYHSGLFAYLNTNKDSLALDLSSSQDRKKLYQLLATADAIIDDHHPDWLANFGLDPEQLATKFPLLITTAISPFGRDAHKSHWHAKSLNVFHSSGWGYHTPTAPETSVPPLKGPGRFLPDYEGALEAALCTVASLIWRRNNPTDNGYAIDVSQRDVLISRADLVLGRMLIGVDEPGHKRTAFDQPGPAGFFPCADGAVYLYVTNQKHWAGLQVLLEHPEWMQEYDKDWLEFGVNPQRVANFRNHFRAWIKDKTKVSTSDIAQRLGVPLVPVNNARDVQESPQYQHREFFTSLTHPTLGSALYPTVPYKFSVSPASLERPAPTLNCHADNIYEEQLEATPNHAGLPSRKTSRSGPLAGVRVVEITKVWAGPYAGKLLALLGAEVIKVESYTNLDELRAFGGVDVDHAPFYVSVNQEILSVQANMKSEEGQKYVGELIARSDIVIDNLRPGAMERLHLGYDDLVRINPEIIAVSIKMFGNDGPLGHQTGYAPSFTALGGLSDLVGLEADNPLGINMRYGDATVGANAAYAAVVALLHKQHTGKGQYVDVSAVECMSAMVGDSFLEYSLTGKIPVADGNHHPQMAPHGCYPCLDGEWISIAVDSNPQWQRLCAILGEAELAENPLFVDMRLRQTNLNELDQRISTLTSRHAAGVLAERLLEEGIGASKSMSSLDLMGNTELWHRQIFRFVRDDKDEKRPVVGVGWQIPENPTEIAQGAPLLGQHNDYVYGEILGLSATEIADLKAKKVIY